MRQLAKPTEIPRGDLNLLAVRAANHGVVIPAPLSLSIHPRLLRALLQR